MRLGLLVFSGLFLFSCTSSETNDLRSREDASGNGHQDSNDSVQSADTVTGAKTVTGTIDLGQTLSPSAQLTLHPMGSDLGWEAEIAEATIDANGHYRFEKVPLEKDRWYGMKLVQPSTNLVGTTQYMALITGGESTLSAIISRASTAAFMLLRKVIETTSNLDMSSYTTDDIKKLETEVKDQLKNNPDGDMESIVEKLTKDIDARPASHKNGDDDDDDSTGDDTPPPAKPSELVINVGDTAADRLDFGSLTIFQTQTRVVSVKNIGEGAANLLGINLPSDIFVIDLRANNCPRNLQPGLTCQFPVIYQPTTAETHQVNLTVVAGTGSTAASATLALEGRGLSLADLQLTDVVPPILGTDVLDAADAPYTETAVLVNNGDTDATAISLGSSLSAPYSIVKDDCSGETVVPGDQCEIKIGFKPTSWNASYASQTLTVLFQSPADDTVTIGVSGQLPTPALIEMRVGDVASFDFGYVHVSPDPVPSQLIEVSNSGGQDAVLDTATPWTLGEPYRFTGGSFPGTQGDCGTTIAKGTTCQLEIEAPLQEIEINNASLKLFYDHSYQPSQEEATFSLSATGFRAKLELIGDDTDFGYVPRDTLATRTYQIKNSSTHAAEITEWSVEWSEDFRISDNQCSGTLAVGASCNVTIEFSPATGTPDQVAWSFGPRYTLDIAWPEGTTAPVSTETYNFAGTLIDPCSDFGTNGKLYGSMSNEIMYSHIEQLYTGDLVFLLSDTQGNDRIVIADCTGTTKQTIDIPAGALADTRVMRMFGAVLDQRTDKLLIGALLLHNSAGSSSNLGVLRFAADGEGIFSFDSSFDGDGKLIVGDASQRVATTGRVEMSHYQDDTNELRFLLGGANFAATFYTDGLYIWDWGGGIAATHTYFGGVLHEGTTKRILHSQGNAHHTIGNISLRMGDDPFDCDTASMITDTQLLADGTRLVSGSCYRQSVRAMSGFIAKFDSSSNGVAGFVGAGSIPGMVLWEWTDRVEKILPIEGSSDFLALDLYGRFARFKGTDGTNVNFTGGSGTLSMEPDHYGHVIKAHNSLFLHIGHDVDHDNSIAADRQFVITRFDGTGVVD